MDELRREKDPKLAAKKKKGDSDFSSNRGSEDRTVTTNAGGRGQKRGRDFEAEKVCVLSLIRFSPTGNSNQWNFRLRTALCLFPSSGSGKEDTLEEASGALSNSNFRYYQLFMKILTRAKMSNEGTTPTCGQKQGPKL